VEAVRAVKGGEEDGGTRGKYETRYWCEQHEKLEEREQ